MEYENDASLILDYELGEISRQYFTDEIDEVDGRIGAPRIISGRRLYCYDKLKKSLTYNVFDT